MRTRLLLKHLTCNRVRLLLSSMSRALMLCFCCIFMSVTVCDTPTNKQTVHMLLLMPPSLEIHSTLPVSGQSSLWVYVYFSL